MSLGGCVILGYINYPTTSPFRTCHTTARNHRSMLSCKIPIPRLCHCQFHFSIIKKKRLSKPESLEVSYQRFTYNNEQLGQQMPMFACVVWKELFFIAVANIVS